MNRDRLQAVVTELLATVYPGSHEQVTTELLALADRYRSRLGGGGVAAPDQSTAYLITYADSFRRVGERPLRTLRRVLDDHVEDAVTDVHLLPMYPWTSDDGFAVVDHRRVSPDLGDWDDVAAVGADHDLMFDFVANHVSSSSEWFTGWLARDPRYDGYFIDPDPSFDTSRVVRPRTTPLVHRYERPDGTTTGAWTTFGPDQVDVNAASPRVLLELTDVLLGYLARGATTIRLDAIGFLWKESGTTCIHLPQTHAIIKVWRALVDHLAPGARLLTETNVPHPENVAYLGDGSDEAHMVYQFALPPLVLHAFVSGRATALSRWAAGIGPVSDTATWFNFLASHDGIGMRPTEGLLTDADRELLVERTLAHGGRVSMADRPDGTQAVYELNVSYLDALARPEEVHDWSVVAAKALTAHSVLMSVVGVPAIYYHSLFGSTHDREGMEASGINRRINRKALDADELAQELRDDPRRRAIFAGLRRLLRARAQQPAFSPFASQDVETLDERLFAVRRAAGTPHEVLAVANVSDETVDVGGVTGVDVLTGERCSRLRLAPFGHAWVTEDRA